MQTFQQARLIHAAHVKHAICRRRKISRKCFRVVDIIEIGPKSEFLNEWHSLSNPAKNKGKEINFSWPKGLGKTFAIFSFAFCWIILQLLQNLFLQLRQFSAFSKLPWQGFIWTMDLLNVGVISCGLEIFVLVFVNNVFVIAIVVAATLMQQESGSAVTST